MSPPLDIDVIRAQFPSLKSGYIYADSAGGSQVLQTVADKVFDYLVNTNVQLGANYSKGVESTSRVGEGPKATAILVNASTLDEIVYGNSSTALVENLARALEASLEPGDEIVVTSEHETNVGPWVKLAARRGLTVKFWLPTPKDATNPYSVAHSLDSLLSLVTSKTRLVAFSACSNILGQIIDVKSIVSSLRRACLEKGASGVRVCVDCVAYAPHRRVNVRDWDVDVAFFSYYKVYGPHTAIMWIRTELLTALSSLAHYFSTATSTSWKLLLGGPGYELTYATSAVLDYFVSLGGPVNADDKNAALTEAFAKIAAHEQAISEPLVSFLKGKYDRGVRIVGLDEVNTWRAPTFSFVVIGNRPLKSADVVAKFDAKGNIGIRYGHFYAHRLITQLGLPEDDGVVRISLVHYHTVEEVNILIKVLDEVLQ